MAAYLLEVRKLKQKFEWLEVIKRSDNSGADELARLASSQAPVHIGVFVEKLLKPSIRTVQRTDAVQPNQRSSQVSEVEPKYTDAALLERNPTWMTPYQAYLEGRDIPDDDAFAKKIARKSKLYIW